MSTIRVNVELQISRGILSRLYHTNAHNPRK